MSIPSSEPNLSQFQNAKFGTIEGNKDMEETEFAFPYVQRGLSAAQKALGQVQAGIKECAESQGNGNMYEIKQKFGNAFDSMHDVQKGFAAIKQAIPKLGSSEDLNAANKGVEEFKTCLTQISGQVDEIAKQWFSGDNENGSINEKIDMVKGYQKDLMRVHTQILYAKEIKQVRIENLKDTIENTSSRTDSIILRWITKLPFVKAVLRKLFGWGTTSPSIQQLEQHFKRCKESLEGLKLASFDLHNKEELDKLMESVQTAQNNLEEFSNYMNNIEGDGKKITEFKGLIEEAKGDVGVLLNKLQEFNDDFYSQSFAQRMKDIYNEAQNSSPSLQAKSAASIISLCEQTIDRDQADNSFYEGVSPLVTWAEDILEKSLDPTTTSSAKAHSNEEYSFLSMCLQGAREILSRNTKDEPSKEGPGSIEQRTDIPEAISPDELAAVERNIETLIKETRETMTHIQSKDDMELYNEISNKVEDSLKEYKKYNTSQQYRNLNDLMTNIRDLGNDLQQ